MNSPFDLNKKYDVVLNWSMNRQILYTGTYEQCRNYCNQNLLRSVYGFNDMRNELERGFILVYRVDESKYNYPNPCGF